MGNALVNSGVSDVGFMESIPGGVSASSSKDDINPIQPKKENSKQFEAKYNGPKVSLDSDSDSEDAFEKEEKVEVKNLYNDEKDDDFIAFDEDGELPDNSSEEEDEEISSKSKSTKKMKKGRSILMNKLEHENIEQSKKMSRYEDVFRVYSDLCSAFTSCTDCVRKYKKGSKLHTMQVEEEIVTTLNRSIELCSKNLKKLDTFFFENSTLSDKRFEKLKASFKRKKQQINESLKSSSIKQLIMEINEAQIIPKKKERKKQTTFEKLLRSKEIQDKKNEKKNSKKRKLVDVEGGGGDYYDGGLLTQQQEVKQKQKYVVSESIANTIDIEKDIELETKQELLELHAGMNEIADLLDDSEKLVDMQQVNIDKIEDSVHNSVKHVQKGRKHIKGARKIQNSTRNIGTGFVASGIKHLLN